MVCYQGDQVWNECLSVVGVAWMAQRDRDTRCGHDEKREQLLLQLMLLRNLLIVGMLVCFLRALMMRSCFVHCALMFCA